MIVIDDNVKHRIYWKYDGLITHCYVQITPIPPHWTEDTAEVIIKRFHKDSENREKARRASLAHLLKTYFPSKFFPNGKDVNRAFRAKVWQAYRGMTKTPRW